MRLNLNVQRGLDYSALVVPHLEMMRPLTPAVIVCPPADRRRCGQGSAHCGPASSTTRKRRFTVMAFLPKLIMQQPFLWHRECAEPIHSINSGGSCASCAAGWVRPSAISVARSKGSRARAGIRPQRLGHADRLAAAAPARLVVFFIPHPEGGVHRRKKADHALRVRVKTFIATKQPPGAW